MDAVATQTLEPSAVDASRHAPEQLAPRAVKVEDTGLSDLLIADLIIKHLYEGGVLDLLQLSEHLALAGSLLETLLAFLRQEGHVEVRGRSPDSAVLRYALTDRGRASAAEAMVRDGYIGPAPVPLDDYIRIVEAQSVKHCIVTREQVHAAFADTVIQASLLDQLGPALHSGKAMFIYGAAGTGKSFISRRLSRLLGDSILIPHAIAVNNNVIQYFDPSYHHPVKQAVAPGSVRLNQGHDPRYTLCERPVVITGGELTLDMLELQFDGVTRRYRAPLQLLANNGMMVIDDLGRQRVAPIDLFNRWIVPLEEKQDFLALQSGQHIAVPFDVALAFSTNLNPLELADEAFLRRIGYKIRFETLDTGQYTAIWQQLCQARGIDYDANPLKFLLNELYLKEKRPLLPCHPRDLIDLAQDFGRYHGQSGISTEALQWAWESYFVTLTEDGISAHHE
jgi:predicted ATPase with chaperone activity